MKYLNIKFILVGAVALFFTACSGGIPKCGDKEVQNVLTDIILENYFGRLSEIDRKKLKFTYSSFMSDLTDEKSKTQFCKAQVKVNGVVNSKPYKWDSWINYSARYTDDRMVYVELELNN